MLNKRIFTLLTKIEDQRQKEVKFRALADSTLNLTLIEMYHGEIDEEVGKTINEKLLDMKEQATKHIETADNLLKMLDSDNKQEAINKSDDFLETTLAFVEKNEEQIIFLKKLYELPTLNTYQTAAFFGSAKYQIATKDADKIKRDFEPLIKEIFDFVNNHQEKIMVGVVIAKGYSDGEGVNPASDFGQQLVAKANLNNPDSQKLNQALSELRAKAINDLLQTVFDENKSQLKNPASLNHIDFKAEGKGDELPNKNIKDYKLIDERRRVVTILWNIVPAEFLAKK